MSSKNLTEKLKIQQQDLIDPKKLVPRGGIEPPTQGFSVCFKLLLLNFIGLYQLLLIVELQSIKAKSVVIECCQILGNNTAYRHLYGHLIICLVRACSGFFLRSMPTPKAGVIARFCSMFPFGYAR